MGNSLSVRILGSILLGTALSVGTCTAESGNPSKRLPIVSPIKEEAFVLFHPSERAFTAVSDMLGRLYVSGPLSLESLTLNHLSWPQRLTRQGVSDTHFKASALTSLSGDTHKPVINDLLPLPDGRLAISGNFTQSVSEKSGSLIAILSSEGTLDQSFNPGPGLSFEDGKLPEQINAEVSPLPDGLLLNSQLLSTHEYNGHQFREGLVKFFWSGEIDLTFATNLQITTSFLTNYTFSQENILTQCDGRIILAATSREVSQDATAALVRLNQDGTLDTMISIPSSGSREEIGQLTLIGPTTECLQDGDSFGVYQQGTVSDEVSSTQFILANSSLDPTALIRLPLSRRKEVNLLGNSYNKFLTSQQSGKRQKEGSILKAFFFWYSSHGHNSSTRRVSFPIRPGKALIVGFDRKLRPAFSVELSQQT